MATVSTLIYPTLSFFVGEFSNVSLCYSTSSIFIEQGMFLQQKFMLHIPSDYDFVLQQTKRLDNPNLALVQRAATLDSFMYSITSRLKTIPKSSPDEWSDTNLLEMERAKYFIDTLAVHGSPPAVSGNLLSSRIADKLKLVGLDPAIPEPMRRYATDASSYIRGKSTNVDDAEVNAFLKNHPEDIQTFNAIENFDAQFQTMFDNLMQAQKKIQESWEDPQRRVTLLNKNFNLIKDDILKGLNTMATKVSNSPSPTTENQVLVLQMFLDKLKMVSSDPTLPSDIQVRSDRIYRDVVSGYEKRGYVYTPYRR